MSRALPNAHTPHARPRLGPEPFLPLRRDEPYIESVHFGQFACPDSTSAASPLSGSNESKAGVSYEASSDPAGRCAVANEEHAWTCYNSRELCGLVKLSGEPQLGLRFEPRCLYVVITSNTRRDLFDELLEAKRIMSDPLNLTVRKLPTRASRATHQTSATHVTRAGRVHGGDCRRPRRRGRIHQLPELVRAPGRVQPRSGAARRNTRAYGFARRVRRPCNHRPITNPLFSPPIQSASQAPRHTRPARRRKKKTDDLLELYNKVLKYRQFLEPPLPPPPPFFPPPLPAPPGKNTAEWPPAPPMNVSPEEQVRRFREKQDKLVLQISELVRVVSGCVPSKTTTCGLPTNEAPDPWLARDGNKCRGYDTRSVAALDFCGYWDARSNPEGADPETRRELLDAGPVCLDKRGSMLTCSASSTRTQRAGVYELNYAGRPDRAFCDFPFFRSRLTAEARTSLECRQMLSDRNVSCHTGCDTCTSVCTNPGLRGIAAAWKCSAGQPIFGTFAASVVSDAGFDTRTRHGSDRRTGRPSIPASIWKEQFALLVNNDINYPRVPRNSVSCRKAHSTDSFGAYMTPIDERGGPITRVGHHVPCKTSSQCHSRCGEHPILGESYVCVKNARLYSYQGVNSSGSVYYIDEPGDDKFDVKNTNLTAEWLGTCMGARCAGGRL